MCEYCENRKPLEMLQNYKEEEAVITSKGAIEPYIGIRAIVPVGSTRGKAVAHAIYIKHCPNCGEKL